MADKHFGNGLYINKPNRCWGSSCTMEVQIRDQDYMPGQGNPLTFGSMHFSNKYFDRMQEAKDGI